MRALAQVVSTTRDRVIAGESGLSLMAQANYQSLEGEIDSLLLVSGVSGRNRRDDELFAWLRRTVPTCHRVGAVCISAFLLARARVLTTQRATVHWRYAHELAYRYPRLSVDPNPIWVQAGNIYTSSRFSAGIDLALAWVAEDCGSAIAIVLRPATHRDSYRLRKRGRDAPGLPARARQVSAPGAGSRQRALAAEDALISWRSLARRASRSSRRSHPP